MREAKLDEVRLGKEGVELDLVDAGRDTGGLEEGGELRGGEVGDADGVG